MNEAINIKDTNIHVSKHDYDSGETVIVLDMSTDSVESAEVLDDDFLIVSGNTQFEGKLPRDGETKVEKKNGIVTITIQDGPFEDTEPVTVEEETDESVDADEKREDDVEPVEEEADTSDEEEESVEE